MPALEPLCRLIGINSPKLLHEKFLLLELDLFARLCEALDNYFTNELMIEKENPMPEGNVIRRVINDLLTSKTYSLSGIAHYTRFPEDVILDVVTGKNPAPSLPLARRIIELHRVTRAGLYRELMMQIAAQCQQQEITVSVDQK